MKTRFAPLIFCALLGAAPPDAAIRDARAEMLKHVDGFFLDADPASPARLERWWSEVRRWAASQIEREGASSLPAAARVLDKDFDVQALDLAHATRLVTASAGAFGTVFILAPGTDGRLRTAWAITGAQSSAFPDLGAWRATHARGPLSIDEARLLPPEANGTPRFLLLGTYSAYAGATVGGQLSIWRWTGRNAEPLIVRHFAYMVEQGQKPISVDGNIVRIGAKSQFKRMIACGACEGRQVELDYRLGSSAATYAGERSLVPELDTIDELVDRLANRRTTTPIAERKADSELRHALGGERPRKDINLGMIMGWTAAQSGTRSLLCVAFDELGTFEFDLVRSGSKFRVAGMHGKPNPGCGPDARS